MGDNVRRRDGTYWFRRRVPAGLRQRVGRTEVSYSLRTSSPSEAKTRASRAWLATEALFNDMARNPTLTDRQARLLIEQLSSEPLLASPTADELVASLLTGRGAVAGLLFNKEAMAIVLELPDDQRRHVASHLTLMAERMEAGVARLGQAVALDKAELAQDRGSRDRARADEAEAALSQTRMAMQVSEEVSARLSEIAAGASAPLPLPIQPPAPASDDGVPDRVDAAPLLSTRVEGFFKAKQYPSDTERQNRATIRMWMEVNGDRRTSRYTEEHAFEFQAILRQLPASHGKGGHIHAVKAAEAARGKDLPRFKENTIERHFSCMRQLWKHLGKRVADPDIFDAVEHKAVNSKRGPWSNHDLGLLLRARWNLKQRPGNTVSEETHAWLVACGGYTGARVEELARLRPDDIQEVDGVPFFFIVQQETETAGGQVKVDWMTKSEAGRRAVAVHPTLVELGLMDLVAVRRKTGAERLFGLAASGEKQTLAAVYSREFSRHKISLGVSRHTVFHSFRHNVETILGNGIFPQRWIDVMLGHKTERDGQPRKSVGLRVYFHGLSAENLQAVSAGITYSDAVCPTLLMRRLRGEVPW